MWTQWLLLGTGIPSFMTIIVDFQESRVSFDVVIPVRAQAVEQI